MALPYTEYIKKCYEHSRHYGRETPDYLPDILKNTHTIENTPYNALNLKIDISKDIIEIPCFSAYHITENINYNIAFPTNTTTTIYYPIIDNANWGRYYRRNGPKHEYKSASPAIKAFFIDTYTVDGIRKIKIGNTYYYGARGILFTNEMKPLLLMTMQIQKKLISFNSTLNSYNYIPLRPIIRVHPDIYKVDFPLEKHIRMKLIPEAIMLDGPLHSDCYLSDHNNIFDTRYMPWKFKVIIDDFDDWFDKPSIPNINNTSEDINKFLIDNMDNIFDIV